MNIVGLDYAAVNLVAELYRIKMTPGLFNKIRALELFELRRAAEEAKKSRE